MNDHVVDPEIERGLLASSGASSAPSGATSANRNRPHAARPARQLAIMPEERKP